MRRLRAAGSVLPLLNWKRAGMGVASIEKLAAQDQALPFPWFADFGVLRLDLKSGSDRKLALVDTGGLSRPWMTQGDKMRGRGRGIGSDEPSVW